MPVKALKKGLFFSCLSPFVLHHFSHSFSMFVFFFLLSLLKVVSLSSHLTRIHYICPLRRSGLLIYCRTYYLFKAVMTHYVDWLGIEGCLESHRLQRHIKMILNECTLAHCTVNHINTAFSIYKITRRHGFSVGRIATWLGLNASTLLPAFS